jgi:hypothetical protein
MTITWDDLATVLDLAAPALTRSMGTGRPPAGFPVKPGINGTARVASGRGNVPRAAPAPPAAPRPKARPRLTPLTPMREATAKSMTKLADDMKQSHPEMSAHQHVRDAARMLRSGNEEAAQRHLRGAMFSLTPQSVHRHGVHTDDGMIAARQAMHSVHRHLLLVKDIEDVGAKNRAAIERRAGEDEAASPLPPVPAPHPDPNAGYGPGALAQKPAARQPGGDKAMNAPARTNSGGSDPAVADPAPQPKGSKQFARTWSELADVIELSAETGTLATTPHPFGKPGGPGLWGVKHMELPPYVQNIAHALLRTGRAKTLSEAIAMAKAATARWEHGKNTTPEVRAASAATDADWEAKRARAHRG